ncbi:MAG: hypothetical protein HYV40_02165 [Candidatus Levybacteria bacterium]|nr:hypothetical protein [Candidatus Levybacteria bacterium]
MSRRSKQFSIDKPQRLEKLSRTDQEDLLFDLVHALVQARSMQDAALFLQDLLTRKELHNLSKRLRIAKHLLTGRSYEEIEQILHVSHGTIAKIALWLAERGDGFRSIIQRLPKESDKNVKEYSDWDAFKRRHPLYFWPELLLEEVVRSANQKQKERIQDVLQKLDEKSTLHRRIEKLLYVSNKV